MNQIIVHKGRTTVLPVSLGYDASNDIFTSEIRVGRSKHTDLIVAWDITFTTDGSDGELILTLDNSDVQSITETQGFMDIRRMSAGEPLPVFDDILTVIFQETVTA